MIFDRAFTRVDAIVGQRSYKLRLVSLLTTTFLLSLPRLASAACVTDGGAQNCSGDLSAGVTTAVDIETLRIEALTSAIAPAAGQEAILYHTETAATLLLDAKNHAIASDRADAISVEAKGGDIYIESKGDLSANEARTLYALAENGAIVVEGEGELSADLTAIALDARAGDVVLDWSGPLRSLKDKGLLLRADNGAVSVTGDGKISAKLDAVTLDARAAGAGAHMTWSGDIGSTSGAALRLDAADGATSLSGAGDISAAEDAVTLIARGAGSAASLNWKGSIVSNSGVAVALRSDNGGVSAEGSGTVSGREAFTFIARGINGNASLKWQGDIESTADAVTLTSENGAADMTGEGNITSGGTAVNLRSNSTSANVSINWSGHIASDKGYGFSARATGGGASITAEGSVSAKLDAIVIRTDDAGVVALNWTKGTLTSQNGHGVNLSSANGSVTAKGAGNVKASKTAIHLESAGNNAVALDWQGDITSTADKALHLYSAQGAVSSATKGAITSAAGGIYAQNETGQSTQTVAVSHEGSLDVAGVGIEARSPAANISVKLKGESTTGSYGIYARSLGSATVSVEQDGTLSAGNIGLYGYSAQGVVSIKHSGTILAYGAGIYAQNEGSATVSVESKGTITGRDQAIAASSSLGAVSVEAKSGTLKATTGSAITAKNSGYATVNVTSDADLVAKEDGIAAQSALGSVYITSQGRIEAERYGLSARNEGTRDVAITNSGDIEAGRDGILAASPNGNVSVNVTGGTVKAGHDGLSLWGYGSLSATISKGAEVSGGAGKAGVRFDQGALSSLTNRGTITTGGRMADYAIVVQTPSGQGGVSGEEAAVHNYGKISGSVSLGAWKNNFINYQGGLLQAGEKLDFGAAGLLRNQGEMTIGTDGTTSLTRLIGNYESSATAKLGFDVDMLANRADKLEITGSAALSGEIALKLATTSDSARSFDLVLADGGLSTSGLSIAKNAFYTSDFEVLPDAAGLRVNLSGVKFDVAGTQGNASGVGSYFSRALAAGGSGLERILADLVNAGDEDAVQKLYEQITPAVALDYVNSSQQLAQVFSDGLMSCRVASGLNSPIREGSCDWMRMEYGQTDRTSANGSTVHSETSGFTFGRQFAFGESAWRYGGSLGLTTTNARDGEGAIAGSERLHVGAVVKYAPGPYLVAAALSGSWGGVDLNRQTSLGGVVETLSAKTNMTSYSLKLRGAYLFGTDVLYFMPQLDLNATRVQTDGYRETGGSTALVVASSKGKSLTAQPAFEIGSNRRSPDGDVLRLFAKIGTTISLEDDTTMASAIASDTSGVAGFKTNGAKSRSLFNLSTGFTKFSVKGWSADARANWNKGDAVDERQISLRLRKAF